MNATTQADQDHPPPPLWRHGLAMLYDTLLVVPLFMAAAGLWVAILGPTDSLNDPAVPASLQRLSWLLILLLFRDFLATRRADSGHASLADQAGDRLGNPPTWRQVTLRVLGALLSAVSLGAGYWWRLYRHIGATGTIACHRHTWCATENALAQTSQGSQIRRDATVARCRPANTPRWAPVQQRAGRNQK